MRKWLMILMLTLFNCKTYEKTSIFYVANFTSDNTVISLKQINEIRYKKTFWGGETNVGGDYRVEIWESSCNIPQWRLKGILWDYKFSGWGPPPPGNVSSALDWIVFERKGEIWVAKRDGTEKAKITEGFYLDFSPSAGKIVFVRDDGLYVINRDGTNEHRIVNDPDATHPAWSSDGGRVAFYMNYKGLLICDTTGNIIDSLGFRHGPDWGPADSNAIVATILKIDKRVIIHLSSHKEDTLTFWANYWAPQGEYFIGGKTVYTRDGTKLFTINP